MSADNRPVCGYTREYRLDEIGYDIHVDCPDLPTHAILERDRGTGEWRRHMNEGRWTYACDFCVGERFRVADPNWKAVPLKSAVWLDDRMTKRGVLATSQQRCPACGREGAAGTPHRKLYSDEGCGPNWSIAIPENPECPADVEAAKLVNMAKPEEAYRESRTVRAPLSLLHDVYGALRLVQLRLWRKHGEGRRTRLLIDLDALMLRVRHYGGDLASSDAQSWLQKGSEYEE